MDEVIERLRGGLVVSCQAYGGEPMNDAETMTRVAQAVVAGGAVAVRAQGPGHLRRMRAELDVPLVGLWKDGHDDVFITPTLEHAAAVAEAGAEVVALDGTDRCRPDGLDLAETIRRLRERHPVLVMADVSTFEEGVLAAEAGADLVGTTLSGYTAYTVKTPGPDLDLVERLAGALSVPIVAEGRYHTPDQAAEALERGAHCVVVGTAITHPATITSWFAAALETGDRRAT
ncbi:N-acetylmannosamine-6-phosphate 2-epimerase [Nocardioides deserti]|uniref:Putative N-acetylmannosamine-6-phosphate 2-epimerase n=1 Tax=Nocardioides deserti TaxID=1588644 RepID=A0ABR6U4D8_9ACTN|nr:N-acetylmannosamine-6-phosphate 2-epimerase [Nocardioides deserti]MBC2959301.1 N-acetylmannosamine-6-phosphate 2-epimerase [Nocardioides deserti]GGO68105.1 putative N-acetylmannosamine-6-phosphate 2-epimerase [Nocardioides deserti]